MAETTTAAPVVVVPTSAARSVENTSALWKQLHRAYIWFRRALFAISLLMIAFLVLEGVRMYQTLAGIHPWLGVLGLVGVGIGIALVVAPIWKLVRMPRVVEPPPLPPDGKLTRQAFAVEVKYLDRYLTNCARNPFFFPQRTQIIAAREELTLIASEAKAKTNDDMEAMTARLKSWSTRCMVPVLKDVDSRADRLIYQEALAVGLATAASPNGVLDAFVMLWRSVRLIGEIGTLYYGRPGIGGTIAICRDVSMAVAVAGYMQNISNSLGGVLAKTLGGVGGIVAGPAVDGVTNALVLIRIGYLAKERCRSYRHWDAAARRSAVLSAMSATQHVAIGLATEILRQVGGGVTAVAGQVFTKASEFGGAAYRTVGSAAEVAGQAASDAADAATRFADNARTTVRNIGDALGTFFKSAEPPPPPKG